MGPANPNWTGGRYSKFLPKRYSDAFRRAHDAKDLNELRNQIALIEAREIEILKTMEHAPESGAFYHRLQEISEERKSTAKLIEVAKERMRECAEAGDIQAVRSYENEIRRNTDKLSVLTSDLADAAEQGATQAEMWAELISVMEARRRMVDTERRRVEAERAYVTIEQLSMFVMDLVSMMREHIKDRALLTIIAEAIRQKVVGIEGTRGISPMSLPPSMGGEVDAGTAD